MVKIQEKHSEVAEFLWNRIVSLEDGWALL